MIRPRLKLPLTPADRIIEILGWLSLIFLWYTILQSYPTMPEKIPTHYDFSGQPDAYGSKNAIFSNGYLATILFVVLTILTRYPHIYNYPTKITEENARFQYTNAVKLVRWMKFAIVIIFTIITYCSANSMPLGNWFIFISLGLTFLPLGYFIWRALKK